MYSRKYPACINNNGYGKNIINMSIGREMQNGSCLLYTSDAADD